jgi:putative DNA primase/helicase
MGAKIHKDIMTREVNICIREFEKFYDLLMKNSPENYIPWFFPCEKNGKNPSPEAILNLDSTSKGSWHHIAARLNKEQCIRHIRQGYNIGLSARTGDPLIIIDIDNPFYLNQLPNDTLTTISRKRVGAHAFCWDKDGTAKLNLPTNDGEIRSDNQYVLSCGSYVPFNLQDKKDIEAFNELPAEAKQDVLLGYYTIKDENYPRAISFNEVPQFFQDKHRENLEADAKIKQREEIREYPRGGKYDDLFNLKMSDIINLAKKREGHPLHASDTDANFSISSNGSICHCWRHLVSLNAVQYLCVKAGYANCEDAGTPHKGRSISKIKGDKNAIEAAYQEAIKCGLIKDKKPSGVFSKKGQVEAFLEKQPIFFDKAGLWWLWDFNSNCWNRVDEVDILNYISDKHGSDIISSKARNELLNGLKQDGRKNIPKKVKSTWIQFKDIIVDIETGEKFKATPEYFVTNPIPWELHEENFEKTPVMDRIFGEWVGPDNIKTLYQILAYCLLSDYPIHRIFCFIGAGMNGKSKFLELLRRFIGEKNTCCTELDILMTSRFEVTRLHKKLVCQMGETNFNEMSKTSLLKKLSGGDLVGFEYKRADLFEEKNYAKIIISTNNLPATTDKTIGFYRRWMIIDFPNQFSEKRDILLDVPEEEYKSLALKSIITLKELLSKREFYNEGTIEERQKKYDEHSDPLDKFMKEYTSEDFDGHIWKGEFERKLNQWCKENRHREMSEVAIGKKMKEKGIDQRLLQADWLDRGQARAWVGIKWKEVIK